MSRIKPYQGTSQERLSELIRVSQTPQLPNAVNFNFGEMGIGPWPEEGSTTVMTEAFTTDRRDNPVAVNYRRLSFDALKRLPQGELVPFDPITFPTTVHAILPQINAALGLDLMPSEVQDVLIESLPLNGITVTINNTSLAWLPGEYLFQYAPGTSEPIARGMSGGIPVDERRRIRVLEKPIS